MGGGGNRETGGCGLASATLGNSEKMENQIPQIPAQGIYRKPRDFQDTKWLSSSSVAGLK